MEAKLNYRKEIDGLRALAVISVIFFHAEKSFFGFSIFQGGFVGVDIFFVLSGFLITSIIIEELEMTSNFSFSNFYERRCRRILPALFFIIICTTPLIWIFFLQQDFLEYGASILSSIYFLSNYFFYLTGNLYDVDSSSFKPMLHTWSLSIEAQFYFLYPIVFYNLYKYAKKQIHLIILILLISSFLLMTIQYRSNESLAFYNTTTRIWEILFGCLVSILKKSSDKKFSNFTKDLAIYVSFILIFISLCFFSKKTNHPSFYTLIPVISTCFILFFEKKNNILISFFSSKIFVFIGMISYSLYLWHFPIFAIGRTTEYFGDDVSKKLIIITFLLSIVSYYLIEKVFRKKISKTNFYLIIIIIGLTITYFGFQIKEGNIKAVRNNILLHLNVGDGSRNLAACAYQEVCVFNKDKSKSIFLIGDSHMQTLERPLLEFANKKNYKLIIINRPTCFFLLNTNMYNKKNIVCGNDYQQKRRALIRNEKNSIVILGGRTQLYFTESNFAKHGNVNIIEEIKNFGFQPLNQIIDSREKKIEFIKDALSHTVNDLTKDGNKVIVIYPIPEVGWNVSRKIISKLIFNNNNLEQLYKNNPLTTSYEFYKKRTDEVFSIFNNVINSNLFRVYPDKIFCNNIILDQCLVHDEKDVFYVDDDHLSINGAEKIVNEIEKVIVENKL